MSVSLGRGDLLLVVDVQNDFVTGSLAVPGAERIVPVVEECVTRFAHLGLPVVATRDWHPARHCSFRDRGGPWPAHCVQGTPGAALAGSLAAQNTVQVISKATHADRDAYSGFDGTGLDSLLRRLGIRRLFVCGLATDYCVRATVLDALRRGYAVFLMADAIAAVDAHPGDGGKAMHEMRLAGAVSIARSDIDSAQAIHG
ncbi:MAG TPA: isochorismatase family protein [Usitatibacter sp.]|nr:isochorismatase family protein [Usitatibacter sp.]